MANPEILGERKFETPKERLELHAELENAAEKKLKIAADQLPEWKRLAKGLCVDPVTKARDSETAGTIELRKRYVKIETERKLAMQAVSTMLSQMKNETDAASLSSLASGILLQMEQFDEEAYAYEIQVLAVDIEDARLQNLSKDELAALKEYLPRPPKDPKKDCTAEQRKTFEAAKPSWESLQTKAAEIFALLRAGKKKEADAAAKDLKPLLKDYPAQIEAYETECRKSGLTVFKNAMGLSESSDEDFREMLAELHAPLPAPEGAPDKRNVATLKQLHPQIEKLRTDLSRDVEKRMLALGQAGNQEGLDVEMAFWKEDLVALMLHRRHYEKLAGLSSKKSEKFIELLTMAASEAIEELMEGLKFGDKPWRYRWKTMENVDIATRDAFVRAGDTVTKMFTKAGIKAPPRVLRILTAMAESPLGGKLLKSMIQFESPVTVVLFAMYLHQTDNKIKAAIDWAGFMATSHLTAEVLTLADTFIIGRTAVKAGSKVLAHPALKFTAVILLMFGFHKEFNQFTGWIDRQIPESRLKHGVGLGLSVIFGDTLITRAEGWLQDAGVMKVNPQTEQKKYLMSTQFQGGEWIVDLDSRMTRTLKDWNDTVDTAAKDEKNPVKKRLWELEKATDVTAWSKREAAHFFPAVVHFKTLESELNESLKAKGKDFKTLDLVETVISDTGDAPNDRAFARALEDYKAIDDYMHGLEEKDPLRESWNVYRARGNSLAKLARLYRHLTKPEHDAVGNLGEISYNRKEWLGDLKTIPKFVQDGLREEMLYQLRRKEATRLRPGEKAADLVDAAEGVEAAKWDVGSILKDLTDLDALLELLCDRKKSLSDEQTASYALSVRNDLKQLTNKLEPYLKRAKDDPGLADRLRLVLLPLRNLAARKHANNEETIREMEKVMKQTASGIAQLALGDAVSLSAIDPKFGENMGFKNNEYFQDTEIYVGPEVDEISKDVTVRGMSRLVKNYRTGVDWDGMESPEGSCPYRDIIVFDSTPPPRARVVTMTSFRCLGPDRKKWSVRTETVQETIQARGTGLRYGDTLVQSYDTWRKAMEVAAPGRLKSLEPAFLRMEEKRKKEIKDAEAQAVTLKKEQAEAQKRALFTTDKWVDLKDGSYRMRYVDEKTGKETILTIPAPFERGGSSISAIPEPGILERKGVFEVKEEGGTKKWLIDRDTFGTASEESAMLRLALTTPVEGNDDATLKRLICMFSYELTSDKRYMDDALRAELLPLYQKAWAKRAFLNELFEQLCQKGTITQANKSKIVKWFQDHQNSFKKPEIKEGESPFTRKLPYPATLAALELAAAPDLEIQQKKLLERHRPLAQARRPLFDTYLAVRSKEHQPGELAQLKREAAALAPSEESYVRDCDAYNARYEHLRSLSEKNHALLAKSSDALSASHSKEWTEKLTPRPDRRTKFVMTNVSIKNDDPKDKAVMERIVAIANANEHYVRVMKCVHVVKQQLPDGGLRYNVTYIMDDLNGGWRYVPQVIDWAKDAKNPDVGFPAYLEYKREKEAADWMGPEIREMDRLTGEWEKNKEKDRLLKDGTLKERLEFAAKSHNEFIFLGEGGGYKFYGANHDGNLLILREQNGFMQHSSLPLAKIGEAKGDGGGTVKKAQELMKGEDGEWGTFQPLQNQGLQMQARAGAKPTPDQILTRKLLTLRRQGETSEDSVRRVMRNYQPKPGALFNQNSERDMAFLYGNIVAGDGDKDSTERLREKFLNDLYDASAKADTGQGLGVNEQRQLEADVRGKMSGGTYGKNAQQYSGMQSTPSYIQISPGAGSLSPGMGR